MSPQGSVPDVPTDVLRKAAEAADGRRSVNLSLCEVFVAGSTTDTECAVLDADELAEMQRTGRYIRTILTLRKNHSMAHRVDELRSTVTFTTPDGTTLQIPAERKADAIFWSEAAVEKFVLPYYARMSNTEAYQALVHIYNSSTERVWGLTHYPTSQYGTLKGFMPMNGFSPSARRALAKLREFELIYGDRAENLSRVLVERHEKFLATL
jgi:hypothetical protein